MRRMDSNYQSGLPPKVGFNVVFFFYVLFFAFSFSKKFRICCALVHSGKLGKEFQISFLKNK